jgi:hypothetical protein
MRSLIRGLGVIGVLLVCSVCCFAQNTGNRQDVEQTVKGGVITLYALDPLAQSFCFRDAGDGSVFQQHEVRNRCSDLNYNSFYAEHFAVGIEGARLGAMVDLGTAEDLRKEYGYEETVGRGQGFASVHLEDGKVVILKDRRTRAMQDLKETSQLFLKPTSVATAPVKVGHIYLARITDGYDHDFQLLVKLLVIGYVPGESVTFRWQSL